MPARTCGTDDARGWPRVRRSSQGGLRLPTLPSCPGPERLGSPRATTSVPARRRARDGTSRRRAGPACAGPSALQPQRPGLGPGIVRCPGPKTSARLAGLSVSAPAVSGASARTVQSPRGSGVDNACEAFGLHRPCLAGRIRRRKTDRRPQGHPVMPALSMDFTIRANRGATSPEALRGAGETRIECRRGSPETCPEIGVTGTTGPTTSGAPPGLRARPTAAPGAKPILPRARAVRTAVHRGSRRHGGAGAGRDEPPAPGPAAACGARGPAVRVPHHAARPLCSRRGAVQVTARMRAAGNAVVMAAPTAAALASVASTTIDPPKPPPVWRAPRAPAATAASTIASVSATVIS